MPIFFANVWQIQNISTMCGTSNSSVVPRIAYVNNDDMEVLVMNILSKNRMTISTLFMKFDLYGLVIAWKQEAPAINTPWTINVCESNRW